MQLLLKKAAELLEKCEHFSLASVTEEGYPRVCILSKNRTDGMRTIWSATGTDSKKTIQFRKNPKASICYVHGGDSVTLLGKVQVLEDAATKKDMWEDWFIEHFPGGMEDPGYCVLRFDAHEATIWINGEFVTLPVE